MIRSRVCGSFVNLLAFALMSLSCQKEIDLNNPYDPAVSLTGPTNLKVISLTEFGAALQWESTIVLQGEDQIRAALAVIEVSDNGATFSSLDSTSAGERQCSIAKQFKPNLPYWFRIREKVGSRTTRPSNIAQATSGAVAPSGLTVTGVTEFQRVLHWTDNSGSESCFQVERKSASAGFFSILAKTPANSTSYIDTSVIRTDSLYFYKVSAVADNGVASAADSVVVSLPFPAPGDPHMTCIDGTSVQLEWIDRASFELGYRVLMSTNAVDFVESQQLAADATSAIVTGLSSANTYDFRVEAYTAHNTSGHAGVSISFVTTPSRLLYSRTLTQRHAPAYSIAFSPDGKNIACGGERYVDVFRASDGLRLGVLDHNETAAISSVGYSPDGSVLASVDFYNLDLWDPRALKQIADLYVPGGGNYSVMSFSPLGDFITLLSNSVLEIWDLSARKVVNGYPTYNQLQGGMDVSPDGKYVASGDSLKLLNWADGSFVRAFPSLPVSGPILFNRSGTQVGSVGIDWSTGNHAIEIWSVNSGVLIERIQETPITTMAKGIAFDPPGERLAFAGRPDGIVNMYQPTTGALVAAVAAPHQSTCVAFSPRNNLIAVGDNAATVSVWAFGGTWITNP